MQEYLVEQLGYRNLPERDMRLAVYLIGSIDEDGYLRRDLESVADDIAFTMGLETTAGGRQVARATCANACCCRWRRCRSTPVRGGWPGRF